jgi:hypothetical protein
MSYMLNNFMCAVFGKKENHSRKAIVIFYGILVLALSLLSIPVLITF